MVTDVLPAVEDAVGPGVSDGGVTPDAGVSVSAASGDASGDVLELGAGVTVAGVGSGVVVVASAGVVVDAGVSSSSGEVGAGTTEEGAGTTVGVGDGGGAPSWVSAAFSTPVGVGDRSSWVAWCTRTTVGTARKLRVQMTSAFGSQRRSRRPGAALR